MLEEEEEGDVKKSSAETESSPPVTVWLLPSCENCGAEEAPLCVPATFSLSVSFEELLVCGIIGAPSYTVSLELSSFSDDVAADDDNCSSLPSANISLSLQPAKSNRQRQSTNNMYNFFIKITPKKNIPFFVLFVNRKVVK